MERITKYDTVCKCFKVTPHQEPGRSVIQELGIYEDIHEEEIKKARNITDIRDLYFTKGAKLDPYWENLGKPKTERSGWIPVSERLPENDEMVLVSCQTAKGVKSVNRAYYMNGSWHGSGSMSGVKAWQPLPDPYDGEE